MNKTFVTKMPNHIGAFLKASRCFAGLGINITRVSYNKALCAVERAALFSLLDKGTWQIFGGHGGKKEHTV